MKKTFNLTYEEKKYILKNTNPNDEREAFVIYEENMQFDTNKFYEYVFADVQSRVGIEIKCEELENGNGILKRVYETICEICDGVLEEYNKEFNK